MLVLVALLACLVSAQVDERVCAVATSTTDLSARLNADLATVVREAVLRVQPAVTADITTAEAYDGVVNARFGAEGELSTEQGAAIDHEVDARLTSIATRFLADLPAIRTTTIACLDARRIAITTTVTTITDAARRLLEAYFTAFKELQVLIAAHLERIKTLVEANDALGIATARIEFEAVRAGQALHDGEYFAKEAEQRLHEAIGRANVKLRDYLDILARTVSTEVERTEARAAVRAEVIIVIRGHIEIRRIAALRERLAAAIEHIRAELIATKTRIEGAAAIEWREARAGLVAHFEATAERIAEIRRRIAAALEGVRCDVTTATFEAKTEGDATTGLVRVQFRGIKCFADLAVDAVRERVCASLKAYILTEAAAVRAQAYTCFAVGAKRGLEQTTFDTDVVGQDPQSTAPISPPTGSPPPPAAPASGSAPIVACIVLLLLSLLFHI
jgi:uncharacterized protein (DUF2267 family)